MQWVACFLDANFTGNLAIPTHSVRFRDFFSAGYPDPDVKNPPSLAG